MIKKSIRNFLINSSFRWWILILILIFVISICNFILLNQNTPKKTSKTYQAENSLLNGVKISTNELGYSGSGYVTDFNQPNDFVSFKVKVPSTGIYKLKMRYRISLGSGDKTTQIIVNGEPLRKVILKESDKFRETLGKKMVLNKGENIIRIDSGWGYYDLDYIKIQASTKNNHKNICNCLVTPNSTKETQSLMKYLVDQYGKKILSGQQNYIGADWLSKNIGKKPAIVGFDLFEYSPSKIEFDGKINSTQIEKAIEWNNQGGIVTISWHWIAPKNLINQPGKEWNRGYYTNSTTFDIEYAMHHPESEDYKLIMRDIDAIAVQLKRLQKAHVPVIFRPLHEAEGGWFWWGSKGPDPAKMLYKLMYKRLTDYHKINNLIWVWNSTSKEWYPGDKYVDIISFDSYPNPGDYSPVSTMYDQLISLVNDQKLITLSENGPIPDPNLLEKYQIHWSWFLTWNGKFLEDGKQNDLNHLTKVYTSPYVITLDELPDLKSY